MRIRALLFVPALATAALGIGAGGASAATLFTTASHATRVTVGATATATAGSAGVDLTAPAGTVQNHCATADLSVTVSLNSAERVDFTATSGSFSSCTHPVTTTNFPWTVTVFGTSTTGASTTTWPAEIHNVFVDIDTIPGVFTGTLSGAGVTASQPNVGAAPVSIALSNGAGLIDHGAGGLRGTIDGQLTLEGTAAGQWSLTN